MPTQYRTVREAVRKLDPNLKLDDPAFDVAVVLLSGLYVGPNVRKIARFAHLPRPFVAEVGRRLRANGVWRGHKIEAGWFEKNGAYAFWLDVTVGLGYLERAA
jgi:hypothetical protein